MKGYSFRSLTDLVLKIFKTKVNAGTGLSGGGSLEADRTLSVKYGTTAGTAAQGNDSRVVNAASNATVNAKEAALEAKKADKVITITAGTGLSGGGTLAANRTLTVNYGSAAGTAAQGNDSRLSDSREWTAETISQAEAEAGTATTRRAFTAQRVRQAIVAWFNGISGAIGRTILSRTTAEQVRNDIGLGTAATKDVGEEDGNIMPVGAFGLGLYSTTNTIANSKDIRELASGIYSLNRDHFQNIGTDGSVLWVGMRVGLNGTFILHQASGNRMWISTRWSNQSGEITWAEIYHTGNMPVTATRWPTFAEVTGKPDNYPTTWDRVTAKPAQATRWPIIAEVTGLTAALFAKANTSTQVIAGTGLTGGGNLFSNRTLSLATSHTPIGVGQTWQDVTALRNKNTSYTNTTGRTIVVMLRTGSNNKHFYVNGVSFNFWQEAGTATFIIPPGTSYSTDNNFSTFMELR